LQPLPNNDIHRLPSERGKGLAGTIIVHVTALIILIVFGFSVPPPPETEEGILVNFGTDETGSGLVEPSPAMEQEDAALPQPEETVTTPEEDAVLTQDFEEAPEVKKVDPEAERRKQEQLEAERIKREQLEAERIRKEQEELERQRIEAEQKRQTDIMNRTKNALAGAKNAGTSSTSEGATGGPGNQGVTTGSVDSQNRGEGSGLGIEGVSYSLEGRGVQRLPVPKYEIQEEGRVVVEVTVDRSGKVIQATPGIKGTTILNDQLLKAARDAAMAALFEPKADAALVQKGTITYNFKLR
jgi:TonB family protein